VDRAASEALRARRWVEAWMRAAPELERIRFEKVRRARTNDAILLLRDAFESALLNCPAKPTSGLVEQQAHFKRAARTKPASRKPRR